MKKPNGAGLPTEPLCSLNTFVLRPGLYAIRLDTAPGGSPGAFAVALFPPQPDEVRAGFLSHPGTDAVVLARAGERAVCQVAGAPATLYVHEYRAGGAAGIDREVVVKLLDLDAGAPQAPLVTAPAVAAVAEPVLAATPTLSVTTVIAGGAEGLHANAEWAGGRQGEAPLEGFSMILGGGVSGLAIEYQCGNAKLGLTPWVKAGRYCGTRGKGIAVTKFAVRLVGEAAGSYEVRYRGNFIGFGDSYEARNGEICEAPANQPLAAVRIEVRPRPTHAVDAEPGPHDPDFADFDEQEYLRVNPDVATAVALRELESGFQHYVSHGRAEGRVAPRRARH